MGWQELVGRSVGNYVLRTLIDQGGVGMVFFAEHKFLGDRAAVKILHESTDVDMADMSRRFFQEAKATRSVDHPNVVRILDFGEDPKDRLLYLAMEFLEGRSVADALDEGPLGEAEAARIAAFVADGLAAAHDRGVIHRDLKPGNIFLCTDGTVKLLDFGLAKVKSSAAQTAAGILVGTPQYMAPEQVRSPKLVGPKTDVYGLGAVMFRMCTGKLPFEAGSVLELVKKHISAQPPRPSTMGRVSPTMDAIILECLEKDQSRRPDMLSLRNRLRKVEQAAREAEAQATLGGDLSDTTSPGGQPFSLDGMLGDAAASFSAEAFNEERTLVDAGVGAMRLPPSLAAANAPRDTAPRAPGLPGLPGMNVPRAGTQALKQLALARASEASPSVPPTVVPQAALAAGGEPVASRSAGLRWGLVAGGLAVLVAVGAGGAIALQHMAQGGLVATTIAAQPSALAAAAPAVATPSMVPSGIAAATSAQTHEVTIESEPAGAVVIVDGSPRGQTPITLPLAAGGKLRVMSAGYQPVDRTIDEAKLVHLKLAPAQ